VSVADSEDAAQVDDAAAALAEALCEADAVSSDEDEALLSDALGLADVDSLVDAVLDGEAPDVPPQAAVPASMAHAAMTAHARVRIGRTAVRAAVAGVAAGQSEMLERWDIWRVPHAFSSLNICLF
jgi:hypothetical protein